MKLRNCWRDNPIVAAIVIGTLAHGTFAFGETTSGYQYPELAVVPKASQVLEDGAKQEKREAFYRPHLLLEVSAVLTLVAGAAGSGNVNNNSDPNDNPDRGIRDSASAALGVGAGWLISTLMMSAYYKPYTHGWNEIEAMPTKTPGQMLSRERLAEEQLYFPAFLMRRIQILSAVTNFAVCTAVAVTNKNHSGASALGGIGATFALVPLFFEDRWVRAYDRHEEYKRKIYGPITQLSLVPAVSNGKIAPALNVAVNF